MLRFCMMMSALLWPALAMASGAVYFNGNIITQDEQRPRAQAMRIADGKIAEAGTSEAVLKNADASLPRVDLGGRTLIPGLIDSHIHAIRAGLSFTSEVSWIDTPDLASALQRIAARAQQKDDAWIVVAGGWNIQQFAGQRRPELADIQRTAPGRAVYIQLAYNSVLISPEGLARLDIAGDAALPQGAKFERNNDGQRSGWITGTGPAIIALFDRLPKFDRATHIEGTRRFFQRLNRFGLTGIMDPGGHNLKPADYAALFEMAARDELTLRVSFSAFAPRAGSERQDFEQLITQYSTHAKHPMLHFNGIGEAITRGFYNNNEPDAAQTQQFESLALWAAAQGLRLTIHWNNDASVHHVLDVFERINQRHALKDLRWSIAHLHDGSRATLHRIHALGLGWLVQNAGYFAAPSWLGARGAALGQTPPLGSAVRMGMMTGGGTDAHRVMSDNPFLALRWMIDGVTAGGLTTRTPDELLSREEALHIYTSGSAWFTGHEQSRGRLAPGYDADYAVLDRDYLTVPLREFGQIRSLLTVVAGRAVYTDARFGDAVALPGASAPSTDTRQRR